VARALRLLDAPRAQRAQRLPLELKLVLLGQDVGFVGCDEFADGDDFDLVSAGLAQPVCRRTTAKGGSSPPSDLLNNDSTRHIGIRDAASRPFTIVHNWLEIRWAIS